MDELRLILLLFGAGIVALVYAWSRYQSRDRQPSAKSPSMAAQQGEEPDETAIQEELQRMQRAMQDQDLPDEPPLPQAGSEEDRLIVLSIVAPEGQLFRGYALRKALQNNALEYGEKRIFHRLVRVDGDDHPVFGLANMVKPGDFETASLSGFHTPGVTLFLQLPTVIDSVAAFDDFVQTAERLAVELGGQLRDQSHSVITHQALMQIREQLADAQLHASSAAS
jgi:cell division protein ZipA